MNLLRLDWGVNMEPVFVCIHGNDLEWICDDCDALVDQYLNDSKEDE